MTDLPQQITFDQLLQMGRDNGVPLINGMPWAFRLGELPVSHESDDRYVISCGGVTLTVCRGDVLERQPDGAWVVNPDSSTLISQLSQLPEPALYGVGNPKAAVRASLEGDNHARISKIEENPIDTNALWWKLAMIAQDMGLTDEDRCAAQEASDLLKTLTPAAMSILKERRRQIAVEGRTPEQDDNYAKCELELAASCYSHPSPFVHPQNPNIPMDWPWPAEWWKPTGHRADLVKAGALIQAAVEVIDRADAKTKTTVVSAPVHVCPTRDIECGSNSASWCEACPKRQPGK